VEDGGCQLFGSEGVHSYHAAAVHSQTPARPHKGYKVTALDSHSTVQSQGRTVCRAKAGWPIWTTVLPGLEIARVLALEACMKTGRSFDAGDSGSWLGEVICSGTVLFVVKGSSPLG
jgi:hypothetical protein